MPSPIWSTAEGGRDAASTANRHVAGHIHWAGLGSQVSLTIRGLHGGSRGEVNGYWTSVVFHNLS